MAQKDLNVILGLDVENFMRGIKQTERRLQRFSRQMQNVGRDMTQMITVPLGLAAGSAIKAAADFEQLETSFSVLLGSAEEGAKLFKELQQFSASTPFQLEDIAGAAKQLLAFGFSADQAKDSLEFLGDIAAGTGGDLGGLTLILGQAKAIGAAYTQDLRQLANRGIPVFDLLIEKTGLSGEAFKKFVEDGNVSFELLQDTLRDTTREGGLFFEGLQKQSQTLAGVFSTFRDNVKLAFGELGRTIVELFDLKKIMSDVTAAVRGAVEWFTNLDDGTKRLIVQVGLIVAAIGPLLIVVGKLASLSALAVSGFGSLTSAALALTSPIGLAVAAAGLLAISIKHLIDMSTGAAKQFVEYTNSARAMADVNEEARKSAAGEIAIIERLTATVLDEAAAEDEREKALTKLNAKYPDYFRNVDLDQVKTDDLTTAKEKLTTQILASARARAAEAKITELASQQLDLEAKITEQQTKQAQVLSTLGVNSYEAAAAAATEYRDRINSIVRAGGEVPQSLLNQARAFASTVAEYETAGQAVGQYETEINNLNNAINNLSQNIIDVAPTSPTNTTTKPTVTPTFTGGGGTKEAVQEVKVLNQEIRDTGRAVASVPPINLGEISALPQILDPVTARFGAIRAQLEDIDLRAQAFGQTAGDVLPEKITLLQEALYNALAGGGTPELIEAIREQLEGLGIEMDALIEAAKQFQETTQAATSGFDAGMTLVKQNAEEGKKAFQGLGRVALAEAAKVIRAKIQEGVAAQIAKILSSVPFPFNLAAAAGAGAVVGALFQRALSAIGIPALAEGGVVTKPTLALIGERGPEAVVPLNDAGVMGGAAINLAGEFILRGSDLLLAVERAERVQSRVR